MDTKTIITKIKWGDIGEVLLFLIAIVSFLYTGRFLMEHQLDVLAAVRSMKF
jgi:hypothetical protein